MATKITTGLITDNAITDAKIADVAITGVTASGGDSSTALATTAFVAGEINSLIDAAPGALNTLNELAAALGDDANFSTTVTNSIATKLAITGGTLTGALTMSVSPTVNNARILVQRSGDDASIAFADNASGTPSSHTWAIGYDYSATNGLGFAYSDSGIPSLSGSQKMLLSTGGNLTIGGNLEVSGADVTITANIKHAGDSDTYFGFVTDNQWRFVGGGAEILRLYQIAGATGTLRVAGLGTNTYPNFTFEGDSNTGMYSSSADTLSFTTGGTRRLHITDSYTHNHYPIIQGGASAVAGVDGVMADVNGAELGPGYLNLGRDDTADASQIKFSKNGASHSYIQTRTNGLGFITDVGNFAFEGGNVGIGETSPLGKLHVKEDDSGVSSVNSNFDQLVLEDDLHAGMSILSGTSGDGAIYFGDSGTNDIGQIKYRHASDRLDFTTLGAIAMMITSQGTFGMGPGSGNLAGSIIINDDGGTGTLNNAYYNTVLGYEAADDLTSGSSNTIVGNQAGYKLTGATGNTLIGRLAGEQLTTGSYNVAIGYDPMGNATVTGNFNIAIGYEALRAVTSGSENVMIGRDAGHDITTGTQSVAVGHESLTKNQTGQGNAGVGFQALEATTGGENIAMGWKAVEANEGGVYNVFLGSMTRGTHPSHSQQIAIGYNIDAAPGQVAIGTSAMGKVYNEFNTDALWSQGSDERLKKDITDSTLGLDFINDLRPVTYTWKPSNELPEEFPMYQKENGRDTETIMTGLIAQEVKTAIDTSGVSRFGGWGEDNDGIQQIRAQAFVFPLIKAVQELTAKLEAAEARITELEG